MATPSLIRAVEPLTDPGVTETAQILDVQIRFDVATRALTFWIDQKQVEVILVQQGLAKIVFELQTVGGTGAPAVFASAPIIWLDPQSKLPRAVPSAISPVLVDAQHLVVWDFNQDKSLTGFPFVIVIEYGGEVFFEDPSIANQPPT